MISIAVEQDAKAWDAFVDAHPEGSFCHLFGWRQAIVRSMGHTPHYLQAKDEQNTVLGILPLFEVKSRLFGHNLCSTPFCMYGGAIANTREVHDALVNEAKRLAISLGVDALELRYQHHVQDMQTMGFHEKSQHSYFTMPLADNDDAILASIKKKQRAVVRHSLKNDLLTRVDQDIDTLYEVYSTSVRNLGTPVFPKSLFVELQKAFPEQIDVLSVSQGQDGRELVLSSVMSFYYKQVVMPYYGGGLNEARASKSNDHMYYKLMCHAASKACNSFDFGRSKNDSGAFKYKATWGMQAQPLYHYFFLVKAPEVPNLSPNNPKYQLMIKLWQKLPLGLSQWMGPFISKYLG